MGLAIITMLDQYQEGSADSPGLCCSRVSNYFHTKSGLAEEQTDSWFHSYDTSKDNKQAEACGFISIFVCEIAFEVYFVK